MQEQLAKLEREEKRLEENSKNSLQTVEAWQGETIKLNVGGKLFETTLATLRRLPGTLFDDIFDGDGYK